MKEKIKRYIKEIMIFIVILIVATNALSYYRSLDLNKDQLNITSFKLINDKTYHLKKDKPLIIYFWATWCPICKFQSPNIQKLSEDYEVITIATNSGSKELIQNYLSQQKFSFNVVNDEDGYYSQKFNIKVFPTTIIYNKNKIQNFSDVGYTSTLGLYFRMLLINWL